MISYTVVSGNIKCAEAQRPVLTTPNVEEARPSFRDPDDNIRGVLGP